MIENLNQFCGQDLVVLLLVEVLLQSWVLSIPEVMVEASGKIPCLGIKVREIAFVCTLCLYYLV